MQFYFNFTVVFVLISIFVLNFILIFTPNSERSEECINFFYSSLKTLFRIVFMPCIVLKDARRDCRRGCRRAAVSISRKQCKIGRPYQIGGTAASNRRRYTFRAVKRVWGRKTIILPYAFIRVKSACLFGWHENTATVGTPASVGIIDRIQRSFDRNENAFYGTRQDGKIRCRHAGDLDFSDSSTPFRALSTPPRQTDSII